MVGWLKALVYGAGGMAVVGLAALVALQERLVYVPVLPGLPRAYPIKPSRLRLIYEDVWLRAADGVRLHSWFLRHSPTCRGPTILFFQENAGNIAHRLECVRLMMQRLQCNVFMLSYRGYGESEGYPSQSGITKDAQVCCFVHFVFVLTFVVLFTLLTVLSFDRPHLIIYFRGRTLTHPG
uniref:Serine aminopeptidase S33 domain-containing protein n=1 Tax=Aegilops tauschii subsp. strangulata TaxID=200361 RepID=A0A453B4L0_AEGTS